jgi:hypothetical protein
VGERRVRKDRNIRQTPLISRRIAVVFVDFVILSSDSEILLTACPPHAPSAVSYLAAGVVNSHIFLQQLSNPVSGSTLQ